MNSAPYFSEKVPREYVSVPAIPSYQISEAVIVLELAYKKRQRQLNRDKENYRIDCLAHSLFDYLFECGSNQSFCITEIVGHIRLKKA